MQGCVFILTGCLSAVFLRPTQVKWQLMVASCYRRSGENDSGLYLSWHNKMACCRLFSADSDSKPDHRKEYSLLIEIPKLSTIHKQHRSVIYLIYPDPFLFFFLHRKLPEISGNV